jgi:sugar (pentulose or hexulose) kinase
MVALDWWSRIIHPSGRSSPAEALRAAARSESGARGARFIPLLMGTAGELGHRPQFGAFEGLREDHASEDLARAVIEGIAFEVRRIADPVNTADHWRVLGGGTRGALLVQTLADVLGVRMTVLPSGSSASGAARLALSALGHTPGWSPADAYDVTPGYAHDYGPAFTEFCLSRALGDLLDHRQRRLFRWGDPDDPRTAGRRQVPGTRALRYLPAAALSVSMLAI